MLLVLYAGPSVYSEKYDGVGLDVREEKRAYTVTFETKG